MNNITITDSATAHLVKQLQKNEGATGYLLKMTLKGCNGYSFDLHEQTEAREGGLDLQGYKLYVDDKAVPFAAGLVIDYVKEGFNSKLTYTVPLAKGSCGCGESFNF